MTSPSTLLAPAHNTMPPSTPSGLTPNTRSEAEAALTHNSTAQTDSAAPTTPLADDTISEAQQAYRRPLGPIRTSSTNYEAALRKSHEESSASSDLSTDTAVPAAGNSTTVGTQHAGSSMLSNLPMPRPGQGVVPLHPGVATGQTELVRKARPTGLSLGNLARQQSWSEQDRRHVLQGMLMGDVQGDAGYGSGAEARGAGVV